MRLGSKILSLGTRLVLVTTAATGIALMVCAGALGFYDQYSFRQQLNYELQVESQVLGSNSSAAVEFGDKKVTEEVLRAVEANRRIEIVVTYDRTGKEIARFTRPEAVRKYQNARNIDQIAALSPFSVRNSILHDGDFLGTILLNGSPHDMASRTKSYFVIAGSMMAVAVLVAIYITIGLQRRIFGSIENLVSGMEGVTQQKDYSVRIDGESDDEVGRLVSAFNKMLTEIQVRDDELELRVKERTEALDREVSARESLQNTQIALQEAFKQANAAVEAKSLFLAKMSHEIRTPMNGVLGMTEILQGTEMDELQAQCADTIELSARNLLEIVNDLLDFSKAEAGKLTLQMESFDVEELIGEVGAILSSTATKKALELVCWCAPDVPVSVKGDPGRLRQILLNLVGNALKFTEKGWVSLNVQNLDYEGGKTKLRFEVQDTGVGIPVDQQKLIFQSFMQVDGGRTRKQGGTGLGLTISKQLVELMGGQLSVSSRARSGSRFWFDIDVEVVKGVRPKGALEGKRVLLATANSDRSDRLMEMFRFNGLQAVWQKDVKSATKSLASEKSFDFVVADFGLPVGGGCALAEALIPMQIEKPAVYLLCDSAHQVSSSEITRLEIAGVLHGPILGGRLLDLMHKSSRVERRRRDDTNSFDSQHAPHILLVEDNEVNAMVATHFLTKLGCTYQTVENGLDAVSVAAQDQFDMVLMDMQLPGIDGVEATRRIRKFDDEEHRDVVIVAMTANALASEREACFQAGMNDYVAKPFSQVELSNMLHKWVGVTD